MNEKWTLQLELNWLCVIGMTIRTRLLAFIVQYCFQFRGIATISLFLYPIIKWLLETILAMNEFTQAETDGINSFKNIHYIATKTKMTVTMIPYLSFC